MHSQSTSSNYEIISVREDTQVHFRTSVDSGSYIPPHWHDAIEIVYMQEGELTFTIEQQTYHLTSGQCILVNPNIIHATKCTAPNRAIIFQIPVNFLENYIHNVRQLLFTHTDPIANPIMRSKLDLLKQTLEKMQLLNDLKPDGGILRFNSLLFEVIFQLYHNFSVQVFHANVTGKNKALERLAPVLNYTSKHYNQPISIEQIAGVAALQPRYFCRFFKKCMGITFLEYQNELKLSYIYRDLLSTEDKISVILERHGFTNYKLFRRMFAKHFSATPSKVRKGICSVPNFPNAGQDAPHSQQNPLM